MDLGLREEEFRRLSPRALVRMLRREGQLRKQRREAANLRAGLVAAVLMNIHGGKAEPGDFFRDPNDESRYMTPEETAAHLKAYAIGHNAALKGGEKR